MVFVIKVILSGLIISLTSWLAGKKPILAGFIIALPLTSMLGILFSYFEYRDMEKINTFSRSIVIAVPLSLVFFVPFLLNKWMKTSFTTTYLLGIGLVGLSYFVAAFLFKIDLLK